MKYKILLVIIVSLCCFPDQVRSGHPDGYVFTDRVIRNQLPRFASKKLYHPNHHIHYNQRQHFHRGRRHFDNYGRRGRWPIRGYGLGSGSYGAVTIGRTINTQIGTAYSAPIQTVQPRIAQPYAPPQPQMMVPPPAVNVQPDTRHQHHSSEPLAGLWNMFGM